MSLLCPSAQPDMNSATVLGVVDDESPGLIAYLNERVEVTTDILGLTGAVKPVRVLRFAASCEESACAHFNDNACSLVTRIVDRLPAVVSMLPRCNIRQGCRWYAQEGKAACYRCPQVTTEQSQATDAMASVARPD